MGKPFTVVRTTTIEAPAERVRALVHDFRSWPQWSPWEGLDPNLQRTYSGPDTGVGAHYTWQGNRKAGAGSMTITGDSPEQVDVDLHFVKPFPSENRIELVLTPTATDTTAVEWRMHGELGGVMRVLSLVRSMDAMVGPDFEKGLSSLKRVAEADG